jgi:hypothetical protein
LRLSFYRRISASRPEMPAADVTSACAGPLAAHRLRNYFNTSTFLHTRAVLPTKNPGA